MTDITLKELEERAKRRKDKPALRLIAEVKKRDRKHRNPLHKGDGIPKIGQDIYVPTRMYIGHGEDDVCGGLGEVVGVSFGMSAGNPRTPFISVKEHLASGYNWEILKEEQARLKKEFGKKRAYPDPDFD